MQSEVKGFMTSPPGSLRTASSLLAAASYFLLVFLAGFGLGVVRTLWVVPALGERWAELIEIPLMLGVIVVILIFFLPGGLLKLAWPKLGFSR